MLQRPWHWPKALPRAHATAEQKLDSFRADIAAWRDISIATDFDAHSEGGLN